MVVSQNKEAGGRHIRLREVKRSQSKAAITEAWVPGLPKMTCHPAHPPCLPVRAVDLVLPAHPG